MTVELLIHAIVHQTIILIAQLATHGGARAPLAQVANQVFVELARELERQGVSRKVSADMFGLGLRTYRRKIQRLSESSTERGRSLWEVVLTFIRSKQSASRNDVLIRFSLDDEAQVRAVLRDLSDSQLIVPVGRNKNTYRAATDAELVAQRTSASAEGQDELLAALMYREGPLSLAAIASRAQTEVQVIEPAIERLLASGRIQQLDNDSGSFFEARALVIPLGASIGWEAAVFDHFKAVVTTIFARLNNQGKTSLEDHVGGSTYTIDVWDGHPLADEVKTALKRVRSTLGDLRERVAQHNATQHRPADYTRVVIYTGQCMVAEENDLSEPVVGNNPVVGDNPVMGDNKA